MNIKPEVRIKMNGSVKHKSYNGERVDLFNLTNYNFCNKRVLDIGCFKGANAQYIKRYNQNVHYTGIEGDIEAVKNIYDEVDEIIHADLDVFDFSQLNGEKFDYVILGDVIEHLKDPDIFMKRIKHLLHKNTLIVVSIPNVQYYEVIFQLLIGNFPRRERGIFDKTHLRWFTYREFKKMIADDYVIIKYVRSYRLVDGNCCAFLNRLNNILKPLFFLFRPFFTYQMKFVIRLKDSMEES